MLDAPRPPIRFSSTESILDEGGAFRLRIGSDLRRMDSSVVIDCYALGNEVHPQGHVGWWKFGLDLKPGVLEGELELEDGRIMSASLGRATPIDHWCNPDQLPRGEPLILIAVVRANSTNAILGIDRIPVFPTRVGHESFRAGFDRDWTRPRYAAPYFLLPRDTTIHIVAPNIFSRDAVGNFCLAVFRLLEQNGMGTRIYADDFDLAANDVIRHRGDLASSVGPDDQILYFHSTHDRALDALLAIPCRRKTAYFHGITSPELLQVFDPELAMACRRAREQLPRLARFDRLAANSRSSAAVLCAALGDPHRTVDVIPPKLQPVAGGTGPAGETASTETEGGPAQLLYVGRIMSHKRIEDLLRFLARYRLLDPESTLTIVGQPGNKAYADYLGWLQREKLRLPENSVRWAGLVSDEALAAVFARSTAYLSMSEDEGFALPLFEAMQAGVPILGFSVPAVRELVGTAGLLFTEKDHDHLAARLHALLAQPEALADLRRSGRARAAELGRTMHGELVFPLVDPSA